MSEIIYYESEDGQIMVTDQMLRIFYRCYRIDDLKSGEAFVSKPDQTVNLAFAFVGIFCIMLGKIRAGQLSQMVDMNIFFSATNYFELTGLILILIALLMALPQNEQFTIKLKFVSGRNKTIILKEKQNYLEIQEINKAINQAIRYAEYRRHLT